jgi:NAD/NADP transhydrogenase beta subunit
LAPRVNAARRLFADENLELVSHLLDDWFRIPGTQIRFGLDGIVGLIPGLGDVIAGLASCIILVGAWFRGVPYIGLVRMLVNLGIEVVIGAIPFVGDLFDIAWKANRRNYKLMVRHIEQPRRHTWKDWAFLVTLVAGTLIVFVSPVVVVIWLVEWMMRSGH